MFGRDDQVVRISTCCQTTSGYMFSMTNKNSDGEEMDADESEAIMMSLEIC